MSTDRNGFSITPPNYPEVNNKYWNIVVYAAGKTYRDAIISLMHQAKVIEEREYPYYLENKSPKSPM